MRFVPLAPLVAFVLAACPGASTTPATSAAVDTTDRIGSPMAQVNGQAIGTKEFDASASRKMGKEKELAVADRMAVMDELVAEKLLYQEAVRRGVDKDPKIQKMIVNSLLKEAVYNKLTNTDIADSELRAYFDAHKDEFVVAERVQVKRILIKKAEGEDASAARKRADEVHAKVVAKPDDFRTLAQEHSQDAYARRGGDLGYLTEKGKPGVDPAVVSTALKLATGAVSEVFETPDGFNIVHVPNRHERVERSFDQMKGSVLRKVKGEKYKVLYDEFVLSLRGGAAISVDEEQVKSRKVEYVRPLGGLGLPRVDLPDGAESLDAGDSSLTAPDAGGEAPEAPRAQPEGAPATP